MEPQTVQSLYQEWRRSVEELLGVMRVARRSGLSNEELDVVNRTYTMRVDLAFAKLKHAEATA